MAAADSGSFVPDKAHSAVQAVFVPDKVGLAVPVGFVRVEADSVVPVESFAPAEPAPVSPPQVVPVAGEAVPA